MKRLSALRGKQRRRCMRMFWKVMASGLEYVRRDHEFRNARRLHDAGLVTVVGSKVRMFGDSPWAFRELGIFAEDAEARRMYPRTVMPRRKRP